MGWSVWDFLHYGPGSGGSLLSNAEANLRTLISDSLWEYAPNPPYLKYVVNSP